jgi:pimeloyl-ACP methyl ester carboxylesterase
VDDLVDDMRQVLDSLGINEAIILGFSFGGNEVTRFAEVLPDRVLKLIYLDAAFDWSTPAASAVWLETPLADAPTLADLASVESFRRYQQRMPWMADVPWSETVEAAFRDRIRVAPDGSVTVPVEQVYSSLLAINQTYRRSYAELAQPTLALFAEYYIPPSAARDSASAALREEWRSQRFLPSRMATIARLSSEIPDVRVATLAGIGHEAAVYTHLDQLASTILEFTTGPRSDR